MSWWQNMRAYHAVTNNTFPNINAELLMLSRVEDCLLFTGGGCENVGCHLYQKLNSLKRALTRERLNKPPT
jgi:hypothetical protein